MSVVFELITEEREKKKKRTHGESMHSKLKKQPADYRVENSYLHANIFVISSDREGNS